MRGPAITATTASDRGRDREQVDGVAQHGEAGDRPSLALPGSGSPRAALARRRARRRRRAVGAEPQQRHDDGGDHQPAARAGSAAPQPQPVEPEERPRLRPQQRRGGEEAERGAVAAVEVGDDRPQCRGGQQALGVAERGVEGPPGAQHHQRRGHRAGPAARRAASRARAPATASSPPARATISHSAGAAPPASDSGVVNTHRQRLPRRPAARVEREPPDVAAPHDPCLRVEGQRPRPQQRGGGEHQRAADHRRSAVQLTALTIIRSTINRPATSTSAIPRTTQVATGDARVGTR